MSRTSVEDHPVDPKQRNILQYESALVPCHRFRSPAGWQSAPPTAATTPVRQSGDSSQQSGNKHNFQTSISEPAEVPKPSKSKLNKEDKHTAAPCIRPALYTTRMSEGKWIRYGSPKYTTFQCTKYPCANTLKNHAPPGDGKQIKHQHSFDSQEPKN